MTRRDVGKPAFSLRKKRFVKTHALSLLGTKNLRYAVLRFQDFQRKKCPYHPSVEAKIRISTSVTRILVVLGIFVFSSPAFSVTLEPETEKVHQGIPGTEDVVALLVLPALT